MMNRIKKHLREIGGFLAAAAFVSYAIAAWATPDWNKPTNASSKSTVLGEIDERIDQAAKMDYTGATNLPTGAKGYNSTTRSLYTTASGTPTPIAVSNFSVSNRTDVTAAGTNAGTAVSLAAGNYFYVSGADGTKGAILKDPTNEPWIKYVFNSNSSNLLKVYTETYYNVNEVAGSSSSHFDIPALELAVCVPIYNSGGSAWTWRISLLRFDEFLRYNNTTGKLQEVSSGAWSDTTGQLVQMDGWMAVDETFTYASATTITVASGATSRFTIGDRLKFSNSGTKYLSVVGVASTTLTVTGGSSYSVANAAISSVYVSRGWPVDFPDWFSYTPSSITSDSGSFSASTDLGIFRVIGRTCEFKLVAHGTITGTPTRLIGSLPLPAIDSFSPFSAWFVDSYTAVALGELQSSTSVYVASPTSLTFTAGSGRYMAVSGTYRIG